MPKYLVDDDGSLGERNDVVLAGLNHKMGYRGTANTLLNFGEGGTRPAARPARSATWSASRTRAWPHMFHMMNEARIGVGAGAAALGYTGYLQVARLRPHPPQGRPAGGEGPGRAAGADHRARRRAPDAAGAEVATSRAALALVLYCGRLVDEERTGRDAGGARRARTCCSTC